MKPELYDVIRRPLISERNMKRIELHRKYTFEVHPKATKVAIRTAVERIFNVKVTDVSTINLHGKLKRRGMSFVKVGAMRKAVVTLQEGQKIEIV